MYVTDLNYVSTNTTRKPLHATSSIIRKNSVFLHKRWVWQVQACPLVLLEKVGQEHTAVARSLK